MKPGPHPWAENDTYVGGPTIGSDTKTPTIAQHKEDGAYPEFTPAPGIWNWQMNRIHLAAQSLARMQASSYSEHLALPHDAHGGKMYASAHSFWGASNEIQPSFFFWDDAAGGGADVIKELRGQVVYTPVATGITSAPTAVDADGDDSSRRIVTVAGGGATDTVRYSTGLGGWATVTFTAGAPTADWYGVACDRDTAGNGVAHWCIAGWDPVNMALWSSADGVNFAVEAGFPAGGSALQGVYHSNHHAGAMGPDDLGNPVWLTNNLVDQVYYSTDHAVWTTGGSLSLYDLSSPRAMAYSMPARRWVAAHSGLSFGAISYSDDNGATWTTDTTALPIIATMQNAATKAYITGDGYGTFVVTRSAQPSDTGYLIWVSVDNGETWSMVRLVRATAYDLGHVIEGCYYPNVNIGDTPDGGGFFSYAFYRDTTTEIFHYRSMVV